MIPNKKQYHIFTHTDLDGCGSELMLRHVIHELEKEAAKNEKHKTLQRKFTVTTHRCDYDNVDEKVMDELENVRNIYHNNEFVDVQFYIVDISVNKNTAHNIQKTMTDFRLANENVDNILTQNRKPVRDFDVLLLDHHPVTHLSGYPWAQISSAHARRDPYRNQVAEQLAPDDVELPPSLKTSGTSMVYEHFKLKNHALLSFCETVRRYDTWDWQTIFNDTDAKDLNTLFYFFGWEMFQEMVKRKIKEGETEEEKEHIEKTLRAIENQKDKYFIQKLERSRVMIIEGKFRAVAVMAEQHISELGNYLAEVYADSADFSVIFSEKDLHFRSVKDNIHLGNHIAGRLFNGGGHAKAAGAPFSLELFNQYKKAAFFSDVAGD